MKTTALFYLATMLAVTASADTVNFDNEPPGTLPPHWVGTQTGRGTAKWAIEKADDAPSKPNVLKQSGQATLPDQSAPPDDRQWRGLVAAYCPGIASSYLGVSIGAALANGTKVPGALFTAAEGSMRRRKEERRRSQGRKNDRE